MTHNKLFSVIIVSAVVTLASILYIAADKKQYDYLNDNIEALAYTETDFAQKIWYRFDRPDGGFNCTKGGEQDCL